MGDLLIAVDKYSGDIPGLPAGLAEIDFFYPDTEAVLGLAPDFIFANEVNSFGVADNPFKMLGDLGINVIQVPASNSIEGIFGDIALIAVTLGIPERGEALINSMKGEIERTAAARHAGNAHNGKSVYFEISSVPSIVTFGQGTYLDEMITIAGGRNIFADQKGWFSPAVEELINRNPDVILVMVYPGEDPVIEIKKRPAFGSITAIRENRVYAIDANSASRPSQNIMLAMREIAKALEESN